MNKQEIDKLIYDLWVQYTENNADVALLCLFYNDLTNLIDEQWPKTN